MANQLNIVKGTLNFQYYISVTPVKGLLLKEIIKPSEIRLFRDKLFYTNISTYYNFKALLAMKLEVKKI